MFKIKVNPKVLKALQAAFPKPANSAEKALAKYVQMLEDQLFKALHSNREPEDRKLDLYVIALREFSQKGASSRYLGRLLDVRRAFLSHCVEDAIC